MEVGTLRQTLLVLLSCLLMASTAWAQDSNLGFSIGLKAWRSQWTTWGYDYSGQDGYDLIAQIPAQDKTVFIPALSLRYKDFVASFSAMPSTRYSFQTDSANFVSQTRRELDLSLGYQVAQGLALGLGYKRFSQQDEAFRYELAGPMLTLGGTASLGGAFSMYGNAAFGALKETGASTIKAKADYRLTEVGLAYSLAAGRFVRAVSLTGGYRIQVVNARRLPITDANSVLAYSQDGRDLTQGFTLGVVASF